MHIGRVLAQGGISTLIAVATACGDDGSAGDSDTETSTSTSTSASTSTSTSTSTGTESTTTGSTTDGSTTDGTTGSGGSGGSSTGDGGLDVTINFSAVVAGQTAVCGSTYDAVGTTSETIEIADLRFFVSNVRLVDDADNEVPIVLHDDGEWQLPADDTEGTNGVVLLDFEDGTAACDTATTSATNTQVAGTVPEGNYVGLVFDVGLPYDRNHLQVDAGGTPPPLNTSGMFWSWLAGYKHMRIDILDSSDARWNFHLGAQGCSNDGPDPMMPPDAECTRPARPRVALDEFDHATETVVLDLAELFGDSDVTSNTADTPPGCQSFIMNEVNECESLWPNLGLDWDSGTCTNDCDDQSVFSVQ